MGGEMSPESPDPKEPERSREIFREITGCDESISGINRLSRPLTKRVSGTDDIPGNVIGSIEDCMGNQVSLVISQDGCTKFLLIDDERHTQRGNNRKTALDLRA